VTPADQVVNLIGQSMPHHQPHEFIHHSFICSSPFTYPPVGLGDRGPNKNDTTRPPQSAGHRLGMGSEFRTTIKTSFFRLPPEDLSVPVQTNKKQGNMRPIDNKNENTQKITLNTPSIKNTVQPNQLTQQNCNPTVYILHKAKTKLRSHISEFVTGW
jgi:hypothetical protein